LDSDRSGDLEGQAGYVKRFLFPGSLFADDVACRGRSILVTVHFIFIVKEGSQMDAGDNNVLVLEGVGFGELVEWSVDILFAIEFGVLSEERNQTSQKRR